MEEENRNGGFLMAYAPRQRRYKVRWKIVIPLLLLVALVLYAAVGLLFPQKKEEVKKIHSLRIKQ